MAEALNAAYHLTGDFGAYPTCFPIPAQNWVSENGDD